MKAKNNDIEFLERIKKGLGKMDIKERLAILFSNIKQKKGKHG